MEKRVWYNGKVIMIDTTPDPNIVAVSIEVLLLNGKAPIEPTYYALFMQTSDNIEPSDIIQTTVEIFKNA